MEKILVGVDGSEFSEKALKQAIEIAKRFSAEVTVVNVYNIPIGQEVSQTILDKAKAVLEDAIVKFKLVSVLTQIRPKPSQTWLRRKNSI